MVLRPVFDGAGLHYFRQRFHTSRRHHPQMIGQGKFFPYLFVRLPSIQTLRLQYPHVQESPHPRAPNSLETKSLKNSQKGCRKSLQRLEQDSNIPSPFGTLGPQELGENEGEICWGGVKSLALGQKHISQDVAIVTQSGNTQEEARQSSSRKGDPGFGNPNFS